MSKRISIAEHLNSSELEQVYKHAKDGIESRQYQIIWLLAQGKKTEEVEEITGFYLAQLYKELVLVMNNRLLFSLLALTSPPTLTILTQIYRHILLKHLTNSLPPALNKVA
jgi:hypothetical protein